MVQRRGNWAGPPRTVPSLLYHNMVQQRGDTVIGTLAADGWAVTYYVTAHPSAASVPITVLLYSNPLLCGFNVPMKELKIPFVHSRIQLSTFCNALLITYDI